MQALKTKEEEERKQKNIAQHIFPFGYKRNSPVPTGIVKQTELHQKLQIDETKPYLF